MQPPSLIVQLKNGMHYSIVFALLLGAAMGTVFNFTIASLYVYSEKRTDNHRG